MQAQPTLTTTQVTLGQGRLDYDNRARVAFHQDGAPVAIYNVEDQGAHIQRYRSGTDWVAEGEPLSFPGLFFMDFVIVNGAYFILAKGSKGHYPEGPTLITNYENILYFLKADRDGRVQWQRALMGHEGTEGGKYFLCSYSFTGQLGYDGRFFHVFSETCGNFASPESGYDVHQGDAYFLLDEQGQVLPEASHLWTSSHSSLPTLATGDVGEGFTLTVGDGSPWGMNFYYYEHGKRRTQQVIFPDQDRLPYANMYGVARSSTDAGIHGGIVKIGEFLYTVIATLPVEQHPILEQSKDLLFIKFRPDGTVVDEHWLGRTTGLDESVPHLIRWGNQLLLSYILKTGQYEWDYRMRYALLTTEGRYSQEALSTELYLDWQSRFFRYPNGDIGLVTSRPYRNDVAITRFSGGH
ncbi:MAG: hypothetical protein AAFQ98_19180 [Bacteroidota bacterium]